jgi:hypothetical protein
VVTTWAEFLDQAGEVGRLAEQRLLGPRLVLVGTLGRSGWPRISPVEPFIVDGELELGMMWQSRKALDLLRDPRLVVHSIVTDRAGSEGDLKLYGRAVDVTDPGARERYCVVIEEAIDWRPTGDWHLFAVDIVRAGHVVFGDDRQRTLTWTPGEGVRDHGARPA